MALNTPDYASLRAARDWLRISAPLVRVAVGIAGILMFAEKAFRLLSTTFGLGQRVELGVHALIWLGGALVAGAFASRLMLAAGEMIGLRIDTSVAQQQMLALLRDEVVPALQQLPEKLSISGHGAVVPDLSNLSTADLLEQLSDAKKTGEAEEVLDIRESLIPRLPEHKRKQMDAELAEWFIRFFEKALRSGKAPLVAPTLGRAVESLGDAPGMEHLVQALPMVRQSAGLCISCGKPYRGATGVCPACQQKDDELFEEEGG